MFAMMKYVDVAFGIYSHTSYFDEVFARRKLEEIGDRFVIEFWNGFFGVTGKNGRDKKYNHGQKPMHID